MIWRILFGAASAQEGSALGMDMANVNGVISPVSEARIPVLDRGFLYGDAAYEVVRVYARRPWHLDTHLQRLRRSCEGLGIAGGPSDGELQDRARALFAQSGYEDGRLYLHVTRGHSTTRQAPLDGEWSPNVIVIAEGITPVPAATYAAGVSAVTRPDARWARNDLKTTNLMPRIFVRQQTLKAGAYEALWLDEAGHVREGTATNVFAISGSALRTSRLDEGVLAGITRQTVLELAPEVGLEATEGELPLTELLAADEVFLTGTTPEVLGVVRVDGRDIGTGAVGAGTRAMHRAYRAHVERVLRAVAPC